MICVFPSLNCSYYTTGHLNPTLHCRDTWLGLTRITCKFWNANLWTFYILCELRAVSCEFREDKLFHWRGERRDLQGRPAGSHHVSGLWLSRWRKGQSRESVTHERMMERFAALSKQPLGSWTHLAGLLLLFLYTKLTIQPHPSRQTRPSWSMTANKPNCSSRVNPITVTFSHNISDQSTW